MDSRTSSYYPPRAGWTRPLRHVGYTLRRQLRLDQLNLPKFAVEISAGQTFLCLAIPGYSFVQAGWKWLGLSALATWMVAACVFILWLGRTPANVAFAIMMSVHVSSILHLINRVAPGMSLPRRLALSLGVMCVVGQLVYATGLRGLQNRCFMPLETGGTIYVINRLGSSDSLARGDRVAFHTEQIGNRGVWIQEGYVLDKVLGIPGDRIEFAADEFRVNGEPAARLLPMMPSSGTLVLDEKTWLVWPSLSTVTRNNVPADQITSTILEMARVQREQIIGKPFQRWFWRDQTK